MLQSSKIVCMKVSLWLLCRTKHRQEHVLRMGEVSVNLDVFLDHACLSFRVTVGRRTPSRYNARC